MLSSIVLSNLFRNENITAITLPREPIPFDTFDSLESNGFTIYTRGTYTFSSDLRQLAWMGMNSFSNNLLRIIKPRGNYSQHWITNLFKSELFVFERGETSFTNWLDLYFGNHTTSSYLRRVMNLTILFPDWFERLITNNVITAETLGSCNKTAVLLPDFEANELYYDLKRNKFSAFLGNDLKISTSYGISFIRRVNLNALRRMNGLYAAGLWDWWTKMLVDVMTRIKGGFLGDGTNPTKASDMNGNIVVVFFIYGVGVAVGVAVFTVETHKRIFLIANLARQKVVFILKPFFHLICGYRNAYPSMEIY